MRNHIKKSFRDIRREIFLILLILLFYGEVEKDLEEKKMGRYVRVEWIDDDPF